VSREEAEARLRVATDKVEALESLVEIERLSRPQATGYDPKEARDLKAYLKQAQDEQQDARRQLDRLTTGGASRSREQSGEDVGDC
jgi:hypothetical protein